MAGSPARRSRIPAHSDAPVRTVAASTGMNPHRSQPAPGEPPSGEALAWQSRDGLVLRGRMWPPGETSSAVIGLVHGLGEHCGRYAVLVDCLNRAGCTMAAFDLRGHGLSDGTRGHARSYRALMHDISDFLEVVSGRTSGQAVFLYGHGLGGNLVINFLLRHQRAINGVVASAPVLRPSRTIPLWKRALVRFLRYAYPDGDVAQRARTTGVVAGSGGGGGLSGGSPRAQPRVGPVGRRRIGGGRMGA